MSETNDRPMSIKQARRILRDTMRVPPDRIHAAESLLRDLQARNPGHDRVGGGMSGLSCLVCGCQSWSLHSDADDERWACERCHREPMSDVDLAALRATERAEAEAEVADEAARVAAEPTPREALAVVLKELAEARSDHAKLAAAADASRDQVAAARASLDQAEGALPAAGAKVAEAAVAALLDPSIRSQRRRRPRSRCSKSKRPALRWNWRRRPTRRSRIGWPRSAIGRGDWKSKRKMPR
jgi:hypothetical protein